MLICLNGEIAEMVVTRSGFIGKAGALPASINLVPLVSACFTLFSLFFWPRPDTNQRKHSNLTFNPLLASHHALESSQTRVKHPPTLETNTGQTKEKEMEGKNVWA